MSRQAVKGSIERSCSPCIDQGAPSKNDRPSIATACEHSDVERKTRSAGRNTSTICIEACLNRHMARTPLKVGVATRRDGPLLSITRQQVLAVKINQPVNGSGRKKPRGTPPLHGIEPTEPHFLLVVVECVG